MGGTLQDWLQNTRVHLSHLCLCPFDWEMILDHVSYHAIKSADHVIVNHDHSKCHVRSTDAQVIYHYLPCRHSRSTHTQECFLSSTLKGGREGLVHRMRNLSSLHSLNHGHYREGRTV